MSKIAVRRYHHTGHSLRHVNRWPDKGRKNNFLRKVPLLYKRKFSNELKLRNIEKSQISTIGCQQSKGNLQRVANTTKLPALTSFARIPNVCLQTHVTKICSSNEHKFEIA